MPICDFCGLSVNLSFLCKKCNQNFCYKHRIPPNHKCNGLKKENTQYLTPKDSSYPPTSQEITTPLGFFYPENGEIELNSNIISPSINKLIHFYRICNDDLKEEVNLRLKKFIKSNPKGLKLIRKMKMMITHRLIEGLWIWLNSFGNPTRTLKRLSLKHQIPLNKLSLQKILEFYYLSLTDVSNFNKIARYPFEPSSSLPKMSTREHIKVNVKGSIRTTIKVLTDISEHARQSGDRECTGYLIGKRNSDMFIKEITRYESLMLGAERSTSIDFRSFVKIMTILESSDETVVGFIHSHPYKGSPAYSQGDQITHWKISAAQSIYQKLLLLDIPMRRLEILKLSAYLSQFNFYQIKFLLEAISATISIIPSFNEVLLVIEQQNPDTWKILEDKINSILNKYQIKPNLIHLHLIPQAGGVICPFMRQIGLIDCTYNEKPQNPDMPVKDWFYYRIAIKKE